MFNALTPRDHEPQTGPNFCPFCEYWHPAASMVTGHVGDKHREAVATCRRIIDAPRTQRFIGLCECGGNLWVPEGEDVVECPACGAAFTVWSKQRANLDSIKAEKIAKIKARKAARDRARNKEAS